MITMTRDEFLNLIPIGKNSTRVPGRKYGLAGGAHEGQFDEAYPGKTVVFILVSQEGWGMMMEAQIVEPEEQEWFAPPCDTLPPERISEVSEC